jgi:hypothetical protein
VKLVTVANVLCVIGEAMKGRRTGVSHSLRIHVESDFLIESVGLCWTETHNFIVLMQGIVNHQKLRERA